VDTNRPLSRLRLLKVAGGATVAAGLAPYLQGAQAFGRPAAGGIKMWWWGQQEAVGIQKWMNDTMAKYKAQKGVSVSATLMDTSQVIPQFTRAAAAGNVPDVQFFFNGIYHMENVWLGYVQPLDGLVSAATIQHGGGTSLSTYSGKHYRTGFYALAFGIEYNKDHFDKAGLDPDKPPKTWDAFIDACGKLKAKGYIPFGAGVKDGFFGEWWFVNTATQALDSPADAINLFVGKLDWRNARYHEHWVKLQQMHDLGYINKDVNSRQLYQGIQLFDTGKASMCLNNSAALPNSQKQLGADNVGFMVFPVFGKGKMAGQPILDTQGFGIPKKAGDPKDAAAFIDFMHSKERLQAYWKTSKQIPADDRFDASVIDVPLLKQVQKKWIAGKHAVYIADLMPTKFWTDAMFVASQKILAGTLKGDKSGDLAHQVTDTWKKQNPLLVRNYGTWGKSLG
jgi:raffinose/stachyose/melibiose transport system substrate-binding protein